MLRERDVTRTQTVDDLLQRAAAGETVMFAHRGGRTCEEIDGAPENSVKNVTKAIRMGFDGCETDLWRTADGKFVIHHDPTLDRTTTGSGNVRDATFEQLRKLRLKYSTGRVSEQTIPTLEELLAAGGGRMVFLVELMGTTSRYFPEILDIVKSGGWTDHVMYWIAYNAESVKHCERFLAEGIEEVKTDVVWRVRSPQQFEEVFAKFGPRLIDLRAGTPANGWSEKTYKNLLPQAHLALVEAAMERPVGIMVSRLRINPYLELLYERGVRIFMSRNPERQLVYLIETGRHF